MNSKNTNTQEAVLSQTNKDLVSSVFIVSVLLNLFFFISWLVVSASTHYSLFLVTH